MLLFSLIASSWAGVYSGLAIPGATGSFSSVTSTDIYGLMINPASSNTSSPTLYIDAAAMYFALNHYIEGPEQEMLIERYGELPEGWYPIKGPVQAQGFVPNIGIGATLPLKSWGIGFHSFIPYGTGANLDENGPQRYRTTGGSLLFLESALSASKAIPIQETKLTIGASFRHLYSTTESQSSIDTGSIIYSLTGDPELILDPLMEGRRSITGSGQGFAFGVGAHFEHPLFSLHAGYRSSVPVRLRGSFDTLLSTSLNLSFQGDAQINFRLPQELSVGLVVPFHNHEIHLDGGWSDWAQYRQTNIALTDMQIVSEDAFFQSLLESYELTTNDLLTADQQIIADSGQFAAFYGRIAWHNQLRENLTLISRLGYSTSSTSLNYTAVNSGDYNTFQIGMGALWNTSSKHTIGIKLLYLFRPPRIVEDSIFSVYNDGENGPNGLSGNGSYKISMFRMGCTSTFRF